MKHRDKLPFCFYIWTRDFPTQPSICSLLQASRTPAHSHVNTSGGVPQQKEALVRSQGQYKSEDWLWMLQWEPDEERTAIAFSPGFSLRDEGELMGYEGDSVSRVSWDTVSRTQAPSGAYGRPSVTECLTTTSLATIPPTKHKAPG